jgi:hypothetical protein
LPHKLQARDVSRHPCGRTPIRLVGLKEKGRAQFYGWCAALTRVCPRIPGNHQKKYTATETQNDLLLCALDNRVGPMRQLRCSTYLVTE